MQMAAFRWVTSTDPKVVVGAPFRTIVDHGIQVGIHGDGVHIAPLNPWLHIYFATTGVNSFGARVNGDQQITRQEALRLFTRGNSWFLRMEDKIGSIEPGKLADLAVLSDDYFAVPDERDQADPLGAHDRRRQDRQRRGRGIAVLAAIVKLLRLSGQIRVDQRHESVGRDGAAHPALVEVGRRLRGDHLFQRFPGADGAQHAIAHGGKHLQLLLDFLEPDDRPEMARNDFGVRVRDLHDLPSRRPSCRRPSRRR